MGPQSNIDVKVKLILKGVSRKVEEGKGSQLSAASNNNMKTIRTTSSAYFFIADTRRARHACAYNQSEQRATTSSSLMIEEVEDRPRWSSTGIEPGGLWLASKGLAY